MEDCVGAISAATFLGMTENLSNLTFLSLTGCHGVQDVRHVGRNLRKLRQLRLNNVWTMNVERNLQPLTTLPNLKILHVENGLDLDEERVYEVSNCCQATVQMFSKLDVFVLSGLMAFHQAVLVYVTAQSLKSIYKEMTVEVTSDMMSDDSVDGEESSQIRCVYRPLST